MTEETPISLERKCRNCQIAFRPDSFEVFCSPECTVEGNARPRQEEPQKKVEPALEIAEEQFQNNVIELAKTLKWNYYHTHNSKRSKKGFPDLTLWRERVVFAELKKEGGHPTADQATAIEQLRGAGAEVYIWWPSDWEEIARVLK